MSGPIPRPTREEREYDLKNRIGRYELESMYRMHEPDDKWKTMSREALADYIVEQEYGKAT